MNTERTRKLVEQCKLSAAWLDFHFGQTLTLDEDQLAFLVFADHVETWRWQLTNVIERLKAGPAEDYSPMKTWPTAGWVAYYDGQVGMIDVASTAKLASIGCGDRDYTPGFDRFRRLFDEACALLRPLREQYLPESPEFHYPEHKPNHSTIGGPE